LKSILTSAKAGTSYCLACWISTIWLWGSTAATVAWPLTHEQLFILAGLNSIKQCTRLPEIGIRHMNEHIVPDSGGHLVWQQLLVVNLCLALVDTWIGYDENSSQSHDCTLVI